MADYYASELSKSKEDRKITSLKERSQENSLKNELTALQHSLQSEIDLQAKKILSLEEKVQRKMRELVDKDNFIKEFLLGRVKDIGFLSFDQLITTIHRHFTPDQQEQDVQMEQEVLDREMQTDWEEVEGVESEDSLEAVESIVIM